VGGNYSFEPEGSQEHDFTRAHGVVLRLRLLRLCQGTPILLALSKRMAIDAEPKQRMVMVDDDRAVCSRSKRSYALQYCIYLQVGTTCALGRWRNSAIMLTYSLNAESDSEHRPHGPDRARAGHFIGKSIKCAPVAHAPAVPATPPHALPPHHFL